MHRSASDKLLRLVQEYLAPCTTQPLVIYEIGSMVAEATQYSIRPQLTRGPWKYIGVDIAPGENVDLVLRDPFDWQEIASASVDVILCNQVFEHVAYPWLTMQEIARALKPHGVAFIISPAGGIEHRFPLDCWRIYPDGWAQLCDYAKLTPIEIYAQWKAWFYTDGSDKWQDSCLVAQKPAAVGAPASVIGPLSSKNVLPHMAEERKKQVGLYPLRYKRKVLSFHGRAFLRELFSFVR